MFEAILLPEARAARDLLNDEDRIEVNSIIQILELNPWTDDITKFTVVINDVGLGVYDDGRWEVVYRVVDDRFIEVIGISHIRG
ncbi:MAG: hypothetical protein ACRDJE_08220 [Dehalococcoidia bacterium]